MSTMKRLLLPCLFLLNIGCNVLISMGLSVTKIYMAELFIYFSCAKAEDLEDCDLALKKKKISDLSDKEIYYINDSSSSFRSRQDHFGTSFINTKIIFCLNEQIVYNSEADMDFLSEVIGETVILGLDSLVLGFCVHQLSKCKQILNGLQAAPVLDLDSTLTKEVSKYPNNTIPYVVIRGLVKPLGTPITSNYNNTVTGVIQRLTIKEHVIARTSAGFWSDQTRTIHEVCNATPFVLMNGKFKVEVVDALAAELLDMDVISDKFEPMSPGVIDHVWGFFSGVRQRGLQTMEEMLRDGSYITAIGELRRSSTGAMKIQPPSDGLPLYLTTATKSSLLKRLTSSRDFLRILLAVFGTVAIVASGRIVYKYIKRRKRREVEDKVKKQLAEGRKERRALARDKTLTEMQLCVVCTENPKEIILLPCGHVCLCEDCSDNIKDNCPICRKTIESRAPAFIT